VLEHPSTRTRYNDSELAVLLRRQLSLLMKHRLSIVGILLFSSLLAAPPLRAQDGLAGALSALAGSSHSASDFRAPFIAANFDNDQKPDGALLRETGLQDGERFFRIELHLTNDINNVIAFSSPERELSISALDVDRDGAQDIVVEKSFSHERLQVFLNDGHGAFHRVRAEDYPSSDPAAPDWGSHQNLSSPVCCLPPSRSVDAVSLHRVSMLNRDSSERSISWPEVLVLQSGARAPSAARAPPSFLSL